MRYRIVAKKEEICANCEYWGVDLQYIIQDYGFCKMQVVVESVMPMHRKENKDRVILVDVSDTVSLYDTKVLFGSQFCCMYFKQKKSENGNGNGHTGN